MLTAYECFSDERDVIVASRLVVRQSLDAYRASDVEADRRRAMEPFVEDERSEHTRGARSDSEMTR